MSVRSALLVLCGVLATACGSGAVTGDVDASALDAAAEMDAGAPRDAADGLDGGADAAACDGLVGTFAITDWLHVSGLGRVGVDHLVFGSRYPEDGGGEGWPLVLRRDTGGTIAWAVELVAPEIADRSADTVFLARGAAAPDGSFRSSFASPSTWTVLRGSATGSVEWAVSFAAPGGARFAPRVALAVGPDGGTVATATLADDVVVVALDERGAVVWQLALRAPDLELATGLARLASGDIVLLAWSTSFSDITYEGPFGARPLELAWVLTLGPDGAVRQQRAIRAAFAVPDLVRPELTLVAEDTSGTLRIGGSAWGAGGMWGFTQSSWILAVDATGAIAGSRRLHSVDRGNSSLVALDAAGRGRWVLLGETSAGAFLTTFSTAGAVVRHQDLLTASALAGALGDGYLLAATLPPCGYIEDRPELCGDARADGAFVELARAGDGFVLPPCAEAFAVEPPSAPAVEAVDVLTIDTDAVAVPGDLAAVTADIEARALDITPASLCFAPGCTNE